MAKQKSYTNRHYLNQETLEEDLNTSNFEYYNKENNFINDQIPKNFNSKKTELINAITAIKKSMDITKSFSNRQKASDKPLSQTNNNDKSSENYRNTRKIGKIVN